MRKAICLTVFLCFAASADAAPELVDPTRPPDAGLMPDATDELSDDLRLDAVGISEERCVAIVNGMSVQSGDEVAGRHVVEIRPWGVLLDDAGERLELRLSPKTKESAGPPPEEP